MTDFVSSKARIQRMAHTLEPFLTREEQSPARARGHIPKNSISRSYFLMRTLVGCLGLALPTLLLLGDFFLLAADFSVRGSLSAYYHSGMRDVFVGVLCVVGILLITYKITERNRGNTLSTIAGIAALIVALLPTHLPPGVDRVALTPLQERLGEELVGSLHYVFAAIFIVALGVLCYDFAIRERKRPQQRSGRSASHSPEFWYRFHLSMASLIGLAALYIVLTKVLGLFDRHSLLIGETIVAIAFGASWLAKGLERDVLPDLRGATSGWPTDDGSTSG